MPDCFPKCTRELTTYAYWPGMGTSVTPFPFRLVGNDTNFWPSCRIMIVNLHFPWLFSEVTDLFVFIRQWICSSGNCVFILFAYIRYWFVCLFLIDFLFWLYVLGNLSGGGLSFNLVYGVYCCLKTLSFTLVKWTTFFFHLCFVLF